MAPSRLICALASLVVVLCCSADAFTVGSGSLSSGTVVAASRPRESILPQCHRARRPAPGTSRGTTALLGKKDARSQGNQPKSKAERPVRKPKDDVIEIEGVVLESLPNAMFRCQIEGASENQEPILATISGKIRKNFVKILVGDRVLIELSPYDLTRGRITFRYR